MVSKATTSMSISHLLSIKNSASIVSWHLASNTSTLFFFLFWPDKILEPQTFCVNPFVLWFLCERKKTSHWEREKQDIKIGSCAQFNLFFFSLSTESLHGSALMQHHNQQSVVCSLPSWTQKDQASSISSFTVFFWLFVYTYLFKPGDFLVSALRWGLPCAAVVCGPGQLLTLLLVTLLLPFIFSRVVCNLQISASLPSSLLFLFCACPEHGPLLFAGKQPTLMVTARCPPPARDRFLPCKREARFSKRNASLEIFWMFVGFTFRPELSSCTGISLVWGSQASSKERELSFVKLQDFI